jgi:hypothetical protein
VDPLDLHGRLATAIALYLAALGIWGLVLGAVGSGPTASFRGAIVIVEAAIVAQGALGVVAWPARGPAQWIHVLYGLALVLALPLGATVVREGTPRRTSLTLGLAALFAAGLCVRGITTA